MIIITPLDGVIIFENCEGIMEMMALSECRVELMKKLEGKVLEVGVGTGKNIKYYESLHNVSTIQV